MTFMHCVSEESKDSHFLLGATMSVATLRKFLYYSASAGMFFPSIPLECMECSVVFVTSVLGFLHFKTSPGFLEIHPFCLDLAN